MLVNCLLEGMSRLADQTAAIDPLRSVTYAQLGTLARVIRRVVLRQTACPRVGVMMPSSVGGLASLCGTLWAGRTVVPLNFLLQPRELNVIIADAGIDLLLTTAHFRCLAEKLSVRPLFIEELGLKWRYLRERLSSTPAPPPVGPHDIAAIVYTSGTSAAPKGVCLTHNNLESNARAAIEHLHITPDQHLLGVIPPFHVFGLMVMHILPIVLQGTVHFIPRFSPQAAYETMMRPEIGIFMAVPSMYTAIGRLKSIDPSKLRHIRITASGGEPLPRPTYETVLERTGLHLIEGYGMTETSPIISVDLPWAHRVGTVGPPLPGIEIRVRGNDGQPVEAGAEGELRVRGPSIMKGYYNKPAETAATIDRDGWLRTGDLVRLSPDRYITITGRAKDLIIVGGENVSPREVESVLELHKAVREAAVVGRPDASRGEAVVAFVTLHEGQTITPAELRSYCNDHLGRYKVPREVHIQPDLPRGPTGKILKRELVVPGESPLTSEGS